MRVEHAAHRVGHALGLGIGQRVGDGALQFRIDFIERRGHQRPNEIAVRALPFRLKLRTHLDKDGPRCLLPEAPIRAVYIGDQGLGGCEEFAVVDTVVEHRPVLAAFVIEVENEVTLGIVEAFDEGSGEVEHDTGVSAFEGLRDEVAERRGLARAGRTESDHMVLFAVEREGDGGDLVRGDKADFLPVFEWHGEGLLDRHVREKLERNLAELFIVATQDSGHEIVAVGEFRSALVMFFQHVLAAAFCPWNEPEREDASADCSEDEAANESIGQLAPGEFNFGDIGDISHVG